MGGMPRIETSTIPSGLPIHRIELPGTRATTVLVAFDAGARTERREENGMAHFLEHLVFKGGEKYDHYRKVNETAERMGAVLNAYTSHDLVAFHITCRAEVVDEAIDLLTDFVGRPKIDADELDRERGVVIQEIARSDDQPSVVAEKLIDRAAFGDHPLGRPVLGPAEHLRTFTREDIVAFRGRQWAGSRGGAFLVGNLEHLPDDNELAEAFGRFPSISANGGSEPAPPFSPQTLVEHRDVEPVAPADVLPAVDRRRRIPRTARRSASTPRCSAGRWARACSTRSASSAGSPTPSTRSTTRSPTSRSCSSPRAWTRASAPRRSLAWARSSTSCARTARTRRSSSGPAPTPPAGASWRSRTPTRWRATRPRRRSSSAASIDPDDAIAALDRTSFDQVAEVARGISEQASVAVVGPHEDDDFTN